MNFSKTASYSLNILSFMAKYQEMKMSAAYLNKKLHIPYPYLRQILANLSKQGFIQSIKGRNGGFCFQRQIEKISLADIIDATDGLDSFRICILGFKECPFDNRCAMHDLWEATRDNFLCILKETTLKDIAEKRK